ncbi:uncharacterized protein [Venturia canescens]|uniref:uncharacterized protein n=1 Tax=Venturia canescens TaxID=32260 RepID=UPI001C9C6AAC|nr:uncharacterized protein LOC122418549 [Venturia canescens]
MKTKPCHLEIVAVLLLSVIPWPGPTVFKISCPRDRASVVRKIVQKRWLPILKKYQVELPLECPFHESRDIFHPQQAAKFQHRTSQWTCGLCGKSFYAEKHLDAHFDSRHRSNINMAEDAVCLANYCDIMRCDVLGGVELDSSLIDDPTGSLNTDIQVWRESNTAGNGRRTKYGAGGAAGSSCECRDVARVHKMSEKSEIIPAITRYSSKQRHCKRVPSPGSPEVAGSPSKSSGDSGTLTSSSSTSTSSSSSSPNPQTSTPSSSTSSSSRRDNNPPENDNSACDNIEAHDDDDLDDIYLDEYDDPTNLVESSLPAALDKRERGKEFEIRKLKSNCKPEELEKLKLQCQILVRDCIAGLLANLSVKDFQEIEGELNRAICWYLSCDKYWEDSRRQPRHTPWYLLITFLLVLSTGISACYYVISIILGSGDDSGIDSNEENQDSNDGHPGERGSLHDPGGMPRHEEHRRRIEIGDERLQVAATGDMPDHYIYVTYPPELKRRLLESCYNRTTRL